MGGWVKERRWQLVGLLGKWLIDGLFFASRIDTVGKAQVQDLLDSRRFILAFWHSRILLVSYLFKGWNGAILVSRSDDGEIIARVLQCQGHETIRGSTGKGGLRALARQIKCLKEQRRPGVVIPDGPQGPRHRVQPGIIILAQKTGCPIVPVTYSARKAKIFGSWDRFMLPRPFTRCRVVFGDPVRVAADAGKEDLAARRRQLETELCRITDDADRFFNHDAESRV